MQCLCVPFPPIRFFLFLYIFSMIFVLREMISQFAFEGRFVVVQHYLLGRGRRSATVGVDAGVFFVLDAAVDDAAGAALPERI